MKISRPTTFAVPRRWLFLKIAPDHGSGPATSYVRGITRWEAKCREVEGKQEVTKEALEGWPALMPRNSAIRARYWSARALRSTSGGRGDLVGGDDRAGHHGLPRSPHSIMLKI
jgi:hypothetical protein